MNPSVDKIIDSFTEEYKDLDISDKISLGRRLVEYYKSVCHDRIEFVHYKHFGSYEIVARKIDFWIEPEDDFQDKKIINNDSNDILFIRLVNSYVAHSIKWKSKITNRDDYIKPTSVYSMLMNLDLRGV